MKGLFYTLAILTGLSGLVVTGCTTLDSSTVVTGLCNQAASAEESALPAIRTMSAEQLRNYELAVQTADDFCLDPAATAASDVQTTALRKAVAEIVSRAIVKEM